MQKNIKAGLRFYCPITLFQSFCQQQAAFLGFSWKPTHQNIYRIEHFSHAHEKQFLLCAKIFYDIGKKKSLEPIVGSRLHNVVVDKNNFDAFDRLPAKCIGILEEGKKNMARRKFLISYRRQLPDPRNPLNFRIRKRKSKTKEGNKRKQ